MAVFIKLFKDRGALFVAPALRLAVLALALALAAAGCGTMAGSSEILSIDSEPRGATVIALDEDPPRVIGQTPLFTQLERASSHRYRLTFGSQVSEDQEIPCRLRWREAVVPNALVAAFGLAQPLYVPVAAAFAGTDWLTGNLYQCHDRVLLSLAPAPILNELPTCRTLVVAPPHHLDESQSDALVARWRSAVGARLGSCDRVVYNEDVKNRFLYFNLDHTTRIDFAGLSRRQLNVLGYETNATHLVVLDYDIANAAIAMNPKIYDLHRLTDDHAEELAVRIADPIFVKQVKQRPWFLTTLRFVPNSITYSFGSTKLIGAPFDRSGRAVATARERHTLPRYISGIGIGLVEHPEGYNAWDMVMSVYPSVFASYQDLAITSKPIAGLEGTPEPNAVTARYDLSYLFLLPMINVGPTFHTPMGAFGIHATAGMVALWAQDSAGLNLTAATPTYGASFSYDAFLTENIFFQFQVAGFRQRRVLLRTPYYQGVPTIISARTGFGVYFPEARRYARRLGG